MRALAPSIALLILASASVAQAGPSAAHADVRRIGVPMSDLNLAQPAGAAAMLARIEQAAGAVCGGLPLPRELRRTQHYRACRTAAVEQAVRKLNAPLVTARFHGEDAATVASAR